MLQNIFTKPVELNIDDKVITFKSIDEFEFALGARSTIPLYKITEAIQSSPGELDLEANAIIVAIEQLSELINTSEEAGEITQSLKAINPAIFSNDNGWRDIFFALKKDQSTESSKYKQIALTAYLKYLSNRQEMIQTIKAQLEKDNAVKSQAEPVQFRTGELELDDKVDSKILGKELGMNMLQKDEPISFDIKQGDEIAILLANYQCKLILKDGITFIDNEDKEHSLTLGENKIGRGSECKVRFMDAMQRISRLHLTIINHNNKKIELIDHSTYGTHYLQ